MDAIDREIEALKKTLRPTSGPVKWTEAMDRKLLALWPDYHKEDVAKAVGHHEKACRVRYLELTAKVQE